jgi:hypothetical protein
MLIHSRQSLDSSLSNFHYLTWDKMVVIEVVLVPGGAAEMGG